jgi:hypothetical protein
LGKERNSHIASQEKPHEVFNLRTAFQFRRICAVTVDRVPDIPFKHVVVIFQENRTPDNLFQGLCAPPYGTAESCGTAPLSGQYDIQTGNWLDKTLPGGTIQPGLVNLANSYLCRRVPPASAIPLREQFHGHSQSLRAVSRFHLDGSERH